MSVPPLPRLVWSGQVDRVTFASGTVHTPRCLPVTHDTSMVNSTILQLAVQHSAVSGARHGESAAISGQSDKTPDTSGSQFDCYCKRPAIRYHISSILHVEQSFVDVSTGESTWWATAKGDERNSTEERNVIVAQGRARSIP